MRQRSKWHGKIESQQTTEAIAQRLGHKDTEDDEIPHDFKVDAENQARRVANSSWFSRVVAIPAANSRKINGSTVKPWEEVIAGRTAAMDRINREKQAVEERFQKTGSRWPYAPGE